MFKILLIKSERWTYKTKRCGHLTPKKKIFLLFWKQKKKKKMRVYGQLNIHSTARVDADSSTKLNTFCWDSSMKTTHQALTVSWINLLTVCMDWNGAAFTLIPLLCKGLLVPAWNTWGWEAAGRDDDAVVWSVFKEIAA